MTDDSNALGGVTAVAAASPPATLPDMIASAPTPVPAETASQPRTSADPSVSPSPDAVAAAARQLEEYLRANDREVEFRVDAATGMTIVSILDIASGEVIRQIPNEEIVRLAETLTTSGRGGALLDVTV
jgi:flagellar protein FlaG